MVCVHGHDSIPVLLDLWCVDCVATAVCKMVVAKMSIDSRLTSEPHPTFGGQLRRCQQRRAKVRSEFRGEPWVEWQSATTILQTGTERPKLITKLSQHIMYITCQNIAQFHYRTRWVVGPTTFATVSRTVVYVSVPTVVYLCCTSHKL